MNKYKKYSILVTLLAGVGELVPFIYLIYSVGLLLVFINFYLFGNDSTKWIFNKFFNKK